jgi:hypothetical protein
MVANLVQAYKIMGCIVFKGTFLRLPLIDFFPGNLGAVSDEHGELFHQDISTIKQRYQDKWSPSMLVDYCSSLRRDVPQAQHNKTHTVTFQVKYIRSVI